MTLNDAMVAVRNHHGRRAGRTFCLANDRGLPVETRILPATLPWLLRTQIRVAARGETFTSYGDHGQCVLLPWQLNR